MLVSGLFTFLSLLVLSLGITGCARDESVSPPSDSAPYHYTDNRFDFLVDVPKQWEIIEDRPVKATATQEESPTSGITILIDGSQDETIYVYGQLGTISTFFQGYEEKWIETKAGEQGTLAFLDSEGRMHMHFVHENDHYGVFVNVRSRTY